LYDLKKRCETVAFVFSNVPFRDPHHMMIFALLISRDLVEKVQMGVSKLR
jgi:hypothetical protein